MNYTGPTFSDSNMYQDSVSIQRDFHIWQRVKVLDLLPVVVLDVLYLLFGVVGNSIVCYICLFHMQRSVINNFVFSLAVLELLACIFTIPVDVTEILNVYVFDFPVLCKIEKYFRKVIVFSTGCILLAIASERYKRIVKPYGRYITFCQSRVAVLCAVIVSAVIAIPEAVFAGSETIHTSYGAGIICSVYHSDVYRLSSLPKLWGLVVVTIYAVSVFSIAIIYFLIASKIWKRGKVHSDRRSRSATPNSTLQRRVRCHSFHQRRSDELTRPRKARVSLNVHHWLSQANRDHVTGCTTSHLPLVNPNTKVPNANALQVPDLSGHRGQQHNNNNDYPYLKNHCEINSNGNESVSLNANGHTDIFSQYSTSNGNIQLKTSDVKHPPTKVNICGEMVLINGNEDTSCSLLIQHQACHRTHIGENQGECDNQATIFFDALVKKLHEKQHDEVLQRSASCTQGDAREFLQHVTPPGSLPRACGYSRKRTTFIMFVMTLTTALSHLPHIIIMLYSMLHPGLTAHLVADECVLFYIAWNSFFISLATHPFLYGFWNGRFKSALRVVFSGRTKDKHSIEAEKGSSGRQS